MKKLEKYELKQEAVVTQMKRRREWWNERQNDGESWQPNGKINERTSGGKETQRETDKKME